jgi:hypothetical protein
MNPGKFSVLSDTSPEAEEVQLALLRKLTPAQRAAKTFSLSHQVVTLSKRAIQRQNPGLSEFEIKILYLHYFYGPGIAQKVREYLLGKDKNANQWVAKEDIIISKLEWYKLGGEVSERQWKDLIGVLKIQGKKLDFNYLKKWASDLGLSTLLDKAINEAGDSGA